MTKPDPHDPVTFARRAEASRKALLDFADILDRERKAGHKGVNLNPETVARIRANARTR